jgi:hypothetical protein
MNKSVLRRVAAFVLFELLIIFVILLVSGCSDKSAERQAVATWNAFLAAAKSGSEDSAASFLTVSSRKYFCLDSSRQDSYFKAQFSVVKTETGTRYTRLHVLHELDGKQTALFEYVVCENERYLLKLPFLIFAESWPVERIGYIAYHRLPPATSVFDTVSADTGCCSVTKLDSIYVQMARLIGVDDPDSIDYYFCLNPETVGQLAGRRKEYWTSGNSFVISTKRDDFCEMMYSLMGHRRRSINLFDRGVPAYGELLRADIEGTYPQNAYNQLVKNVSQIRGRPILPLVDSLHDSHDRDAGVLLFFVAGVFTEELISECGTEEFRLLYQSVKSNADLEQQLVALCGVTVDSIQHRLENKYAHYMTATPKPATGGK